MRFHALTVLGSGPKMQQQQMQQRTHAAANLMKIREERGRRRERERAKKGREGKGDSWRLAPSCPVCPACNMAPLPHILSLSPLSLAPPPQYPRIKCIFLPLERVFPLSLSFFNLKSCTTTAAVAFEIEPGVCRSVIGVAAVAARLRAGSGPDRTCRRTMQHV